MRGPHNIWRLIVTGATFQRTGAMKAVLDAFEAPAPVRLVARTLAMPFTFLGYRGDTSMPPVTRALTALGKHPIGHRTGEFSALIGEVNAGLQWLHQTKNDVLTLAASGTGAMEAGIINFLSAGDRVLVGSNGKFGDQIGRASCRERV